LCMKVFRLALKNAQLLIPLNTCKYLQVAVNNYPYKLLSWL
jgi:hypothetical protein